jgi:hypothetical protein
VPDARGGRDARPGGRELQTFLCSVGSTSVFEAEPEDAFAAGQAVGRVGADHVPAGAAVDAFGGAVGGVDLVVAGAPGVRGG